LEVDVLINTMSTCWIYFYALSYFPSHGHVLAFLPFLTSGLNEHALPTTSFSNGILPLDQLSFANLLGLSCG
jgi:hypothetical protein